MGRLQDKTALVTGAARGQGRAHALTLAREGARIVVADIAEQIGSVPLEMARPGDIDETVRLIEENGGKAVGIKADVRKADDLDNAVGKALSEFGSLDITVANAGIWSKAPFHELTDEMWDDMFAVNAKGVWRTICASIKPMIDQQEGTIIVTTSVNAVEPGLSYAHYVGAKHAALGIMRTAALEYARHNIRVNAVAPGFIDTPMTDWAGGYEMTTGSREGSREDHLRGGHYWHALAGRGILRPESVSGAVLFFASPDSKDITGVNLPVDAGHVILPGVNNDPVFAEGL